MIFAIFFLPFTCSKPRSTKPPYTPEQKATISEWMNKNQPDKAWVDSVRDHIVGQGMYFRSSSYEERIYRIHRLRPTQVLARTVWPFLKAGFVVQAPFGGLSRMDDPYTPSDDPDNDPLPDQFMIEFLPGDSWSVGGKHGGAYQLDAYGPLDIRREDASQDEIVDEIVSPDMMGIDEDGRMQKIELDFGFDPRRPNWNDFRTKVITPIMPPTSSVASKHDWRDNVLETWLEPLKSHITSQHFLSSDRDERRDYILNNVTLEDALKEVYPPLFKMGMQSSTKPEDFSLNADNPITLMPVKWNGELAKSGLVAVSLSDEGGPSQVHVIVLYGLAVTK